MITLNENYKKNIDILIQNLRRGMKEEQAISIINDFENQFINNNLYNEEEKTFINKMRKEVTIFFEEQKGKIKAKDLANLAGIEYVEN